MITILTHKKAKIYIYSQKYHEIYYSFFLKLYFDLNRFFDLLNYSGHTDVTKVYNWIKKNR